MKRLSPRFAILLVVPVLVLFGALGGLAAPSAVPAVVGGFQRHDTAVNDIPRVSSAPSLVVDNTGAGGGLPVPSVAFVQRPFGANLQEGYVRTFNAATNRWVTRGASTNNGRLNRDSLAAADNPALVLAGGVVNGQGTQPFAAWQEPVVGLGNNKNIFASKLIQEGSLERWQPVGERGNGRNINSLNIRVSEDAEFPALAAGSVTTPTTTFAPWIAWREYSPVSRASQIFAARGEAASGANIDGDMRFVPTGRLINVIEPSLNIDPSRDSFEPDIAFGGPNFTVPWVVWYEDGGGRASRVFASKAVADGTAAGGFRWDPQPACTPNERACAINRNAERNAEDPKIAFGTLPGEDPTQPKPWVAFQENDGQTNKIYVSKFDGTRWVPVGGPVNVFNFDNAHSPDIYFVGNVPHVAFVETIGGLDLLFVKHLGDARAGRERWDLNANPFRGINVGFFDSATAPSLAASPSTPYVAWQEIARFSNTADVFEARRLPEAPAWGRNTPPFIRVISGSNTLAAQKQLPLAADKAAQSPDDIVGMTVITSSCDNVNGWDDLAEVQVILADDDGTYFRGRYVAAEGKVYLEDPNNAGQWLGGLTPGAAGAMIETDYVVLHVEDMVITPHGPESPALDIQWPISFKRRLLFKSLTQALNLVYKVEGGGTEETEPFAVGTLNVAVDQIVLPLIANDASLRQGQ